MDVISVRAPTCEICGKKFSRVGRSNALKTCSQVCRKESQSRHISAYRNRSGQTNCLDADGRLPTDPSDEEMDRMKREIFFAHLDAKRAETPRH